MRVYKKTGTPVFFILKHWYLEFGKINVEVNKTIQLIEDAMKTTLSDILVFTDNPTNGIQAEYLLTVNVAKEIAKLNQADADPYIIHLEQKTENFAKQCLPAIVWGKPILDDKLSPIQKLNERQKRTKLLNIKQVKMLHRKGKVDIAVYQHPANGQFGKQPLCIIEVKSFNPPTNKIIADLERNLFFLSLKCNTGESVLNYTIFAALHWNKKNNIEDENKHKINLDKKYEKILKSLTLSNPHITMNHKVFSLSKSIGRLDIEGIDVEEDKIIQSLDKSTRHHFMGALIYFEKSS